MLKKERKKGCPRTQGFCPKPIDLSQSPKFKFVQYPKMSHPPLFPVKLFLLINYIIKILLKIRQNFKVEKKF